VNIDEKLNDLIEELKEDFQIPSYAYNHYNKFIPGITPVYYSGPYFDNAEIVAAMKSILVGKWMSAGQSVKEFEHEFSRKTKQTFSVMVNSGSSANLVMMAALKKRFGWNDGDEIIVSVVGFPTTTSVIVQNGLVPVFIDIEMETLNFNLDLVEQSITSSTRAIFVSPVLGNPPNFDRLIDICKTYNLQLILDNCDSLGSRWRGKQLTEYAVASSCSFYAAHEICTFEGGMVSSNDRLLMNTVRSMVNWGRDCICSGIENLLPNGICNHRFDNWIEDYDGIVDHKYVFTQMGYNLKPLELTGAVGLVQMEKLDEICKKRNISKHTICNRFVERFENVRVPEEFWQAEPTWFGSPIICDNKEVKQKMVRYLEANKIQTRNYFAGNILWHDGYKHLGDANNYPVANNVLDLVFFIGASQHYNQEVFDYIEKILKEYPNG
jgi:CDP-4-dehydro-6-deoxyglucose reductase, E1